MATAYTADAAEDRRPAITVTGVGQATVNHGEYEIAAALVINDTIDLCKLPAGHIPVEFVFACDDLDTNGAPAIVLNIGIYDSVGATTDADLFIAASTVAQAGGFARMDNIAALDLAPADNDRIVRVTVATAPATGATSGTLHANLISRPAGLDD